MKQSIIFINDAGDIVDRADATHQATLDLPDECECRPVRVLPETDGGGYSVLVGGVDDCPAHGFESKAGHLLYRDPADETP